MIAVGAASGGRPPAVPHLPGRRARVRWRAARAAGRARGRVCGAARRRAAHRGAERRQPGRGGVLARAVGGRGGRAGAQRPGGGVQRGARLLGRAVRARARPPGCRAAREASGGPGARRLLFTFAPDAAPALAAYRVRLWELPAFAAAGALLGAAAALCVAVNVNLVHAARQRWAPPAARFRRAPGPAHARGGARPRLSARAAQAAGGGGAAGRGDGGPVAGPGVRVAVRGHAAAGPPGRARAGGHPHRAPLVRRVQPVPAALVPARRVQRARPGAPAARAPFAAAAAPGLTRGRGAQLFFAPTRLTLRRATGVDASSAAGAADADTLFDPRALALCAPCPCVGPAAARAAPRAPPHTRWRAPAGTPSRRR